MNNLTGPSGHIPDFLSSLVNLRYLNLSGIPFSGRLPSSLGNLSELQYLDEKEGGAGSHSEAFGNGADTPMFGAVALPPTKAVNKSLSLVLKDFPLLHKVALTPMCTHKLARSREDLKLQKKGLPRVVRSPPCSNKVTADGCNTDLENTFGKQSVPGEMEKEPVAASVAVPIHNSEVVESILPVKSAGCMGQEVNSKEMEGQIGEAVRKEAGTQGTESKQEKMPTLREKNMWSPGIDEDSTLKAMKKASRRNLDGDLSGLKQAGQARHLASTLTPQIGQLQSGYLQRGVLVTFLGTATA